LESNALMTGGKKNPADFFGEETAGFPDTMILLFKVQ